MKLPNLIEGAFRRNRQVALVFSTGVIPQDYCEDLCFENHEIGSEEHQECLANCRY